MKKPLWVIGIDEVGRGPLAGPVTVCAVALPYDHYKKGMWRELTDSKQMSPIARMRWYKEAERLVKARSLQYVVTSRSAHTIDTKGIASCIRECIVSNLKKLNLTPEYCVVLLDGGLKAPKEYINQQTIIRGDSQEQIISFASVIAKVTRDQFMTKQHKSNPEYGWDQNKGYGTEAHILAIQSNGISPLHRLSFLTRILDK